MKPWRLWFLLLLAVLLPVRGAVAAAMLCPAAGMGAPIASAMVGPAAMEGALSPFGLDAHDQEGVHDHAGGHDHAAGHDHAGAHDHTGAHHHAGGHDQAADASGDSAPSHDHAASDGCNACSAYCSLTPLLSHPPTLAAAVDPAAVKFPDLSGPPSSFVSDGQERPPRTL